MRALRRIARAVLRLCATVATRAPGVDARAPRVRVLVLVPQPVPHSQGSNSPQRPPGTPPAPGPGLEAERNLTPAEEGFGADETWHNTTACPTTQHNRMPQICGLHTEPAHLAG